MKVLEFNPKNNLNINHRKENYFQYEYSIIVFDEKTKKFATPLILRVYITTATYNVCVWIHDNNTEAQGSSRGDDFEGGAYTTTNALVLAGFTFEDGWNGTIFDKLTAIAEYFGYKHYYIHKSNP